MYPVICTFGALTVYSYGLMLVIGFGLATWLACRRARSQGINPEVVFNLAFGLFIAGIAGARLFYVAENFSYYFREPLEIFMLQKGGLSWFGGMISGVFFGFFYIRRLRLAPYPVIDLIIPFAALAQAIGRIGCLLNGCCYGPPSDYGIYFAAHGQALIPTQIYSSLLLLAIYIILRFFQERPHRPGGIFSLYLALYSLKRFFIEFWRAEHAPVFMGLTLFQILSTGVFLLALMQFILVRRK